MIPRCFKLLACLFFIGAPALANDSSAELKTGGLVLLKTSKIEMRSEDLFISNKEIKIHYVFLNNSPTDIATVVAFPMPRIPMSGWGETLEIPNVNSDNFLDFSTSVNGRPISARAELRAYQDDHEVTSILKAAGVSLTSNYRQMENILDRLPKSKTEALIRDKLVDANKGPRWSLAITYYFNIVFPAGKETRIEHKYRPSVGSSNVTSLGDQNLISQSQINEEVSTYCIDDATMKVISGAKKPPYMDYGSPFTEERISYILHTGANWAGPIGRFHLTIDKGSPDNIINLCYGVTKSAPTLVEFSKTDFTPNNDIDILIFKPFDKKHIQPVREIMGGAFGTVVAAHSECVSHEAVLPRFLRDRASTDRFMLRPQRKSATPTAVGIPPTMIALIPRPTALEAP